MLSQKVKPHRVLGVAPEGLWGKDIGPFSKLFTHKIILDSTEAFENIDCLVLWGGTDIHPSFYKEQHGRYNGAPSFPSRRDEFELKALLYCQKHDIPVIGVCRGAQLMCAFAGGALAQHVNNHNCGSHRMTTIDGELIWTNSVHHQMMNPWKIEHKLLAWVDKRLSNMYLNGDDEEILEMRDHPEPEIVYFPTIRGLAIQGHPEYADAPPRFKELCAEYAAEYLFNETLEQTK